MHGTVGNNGNRKIGWNVSLKEAQAAESSTEIPVMEKTKAGRPIDRLANLDSLNNCCLFSFYLREG